MFSQRPLREIEFSGTDLSIGGFPAYDFFGDGSFYLLGRYFLLLERGSLFLIPPASRVHVSVLPASNVYLLDTPGHCVGHMCGLARTTASPSASFAFLGGDICHFPGLFRPNIYAPLPDLIPVNDLDTAHRLPSVCPCSHFTNNHPRKAIGAVQDDRQTPFHLVSTDSSSAYRNPKVAQTSVDRLVTFDSHPDVMVCLAHDEDLIKHLPTLNNNPSDDLNLWKQRGFKDKIRWLWLNRLPRDGKPAQRPAVQGFWREGHPWPSAKAKLGRMAWEIIGNSGV